MINDQPGAWAQINPPSKIVPVFNSVYIYIDFDIFPLRGQEKIVKMYLTFCVPQCHSGCLPQIYGMEVKQHPIIKRTHCYCSYIHFNTLWWCRVPLSATLTSLVNVRYIHQVKVESSSQGSFDNLNYVIFVDFTLVECRPHFPTCGVHKSNINGALKLSVGSEEIYGDGVDKKRSRYCCILYSVMFVEGLSSLFISTCKNILTIIRKVSKSLYMTN